jgi:ribosomal protein L28
MNTLENAHIHVNNGIRKLILERFRANYNTKFYITHENQFVTIYISYSASKVKILSLNGRNCTPAHQQRATKVA